jgi:hypothetical protein
MRKRTSAQQGTGGWINKNSLHHFDMSHVDVKEHRLEHNMLVKEESSSN